LSKGKLISGTAMWNMPHMLIFDELLYAIIMAIKAYGDSIVPITNAREFTEVLCNTVLI